MLIPPYSQCSLISQFDSFPVMSNIGLKLNHYILQTITTLALEAMVFPFGLIMNDFHVLNVSTGEFDLRPFQYPAPEHVWGGKSSMKNMFISSKRPFFFFPEAWTTKNKLIQCILFVWSCVHFIIPSTGNKQYDKTLYLYIHIHIYVLYKKVVTSIMMTCMVACFSATPSKRKKLLHTDIHWLSESHWAGY